MSEFEKLLKIRDKEFYVTLRSRKETGEFSWEEYKEEFQVAPYAYEWIKEKIQEAK